MNLFNSTSILFKQVKKLSSLIISTLFLFAVVSPASAQESATHSADTPIDSYTLFWPLSPGKTEGNKLYSLKILKENVLGLFAFNESEKVDYQVMLGTKRILGAEKLIKENKPDMAKKTLNRASNNFSKAYSLAKSAADRRKFNASKVRRDRLINVKILIDSLKASAPSDLSNDLDMAKNNAQRLLADYLP